MPRKRTHPDAQPPTTFDLRALLEEAGVTRTVAKFPKSATVFSQGDAATDVLYLEEGSVKLSVLSRAGKEAVVAILGPGEFFGEGCLAGQDRRMATASTVAP